MLISPSAMLIVAVVILVVGLACALTNRGDARRAERTGRSEMLKTELAPAEAVRLIAAMQLARYRLADADPSRGVVVFRSRVSLLTWGFLFPVFVSSRHGGGSYVEVGIRSRFLQVGPLVGVAHRAFTRALGIHLTRAAG